VTPTRLVITEQLVTPRWELARPEIPQAALLLAAGNSQELEKAELGLLEDLQFPLPPG
jgi:hypothetical protein